MNTIFLSLLDKLRASYWFLPAAMSVFATGLSIFVVAVDGHVGSQWLREYSWLHGNTPDGARTILSTIAGSMITVAGVVFSITIATVSYASGQYGPRVLSNFLRDRANQFTLGTFVATFLYCLLVIRSVREPGGTDLSDTVPVFVPNLALLVGILLALCSIAVLIFFVHHVARSIHISHIIADIGQELQKLLDDHYPAEQENRDTSGAIADKSQKVPPPFRSGDTNAQPEDAFDGAKCVHYPADGFIQTVNFERLLSIAQSNDIVLRLRSHPGDFVRKSTIAIEIWPSLEVSDEIGCQLQKAISIGRMRTPVQDTMFLIDQLVEIAGRALSPGVNDPFTAKNCINWLAVSIDKLSSRPNKSAFITDDDGNVRVVYEPFSFSDFVSGAFGQMRCYAAGDVNCAVYLIGTLASLATHARDPERVDALKTQISRLADATHAKLDLPDRDLVKRRAEAALSLIDEGRAHERDNRLRSIQYIS